MALGSVVCAIGLFPFFFFFFFFFFFNFSFLSFLLFFLSFFFPSHLSLTTPFLSFFFFFFFFFFIEENFQPYLSHFLPFIQRAMTCTQESSLIKNCVGLISDLAGVLRKEVCLHLSFSIIINSF